MESTALRFFRLAAEFATGVSNTQNTQNEFVNSPMWAEQRWNPNAWTSQTGFIAFFGRDHLVSAISAQLAFRLLTEGFVGSNPT